MNPVATYLSMPDFVTNATGIRWSQDDRCLECATGTLAFVEEIADFLDGFARVRRVVHFAFVVRLLAVLKRTPADHQSAAARLWKLHGEAQGLLRNAGALCGHLCHGIPAAREANQVAEICQRLRAREPIAMMLGAPTGADRVMEIVACGYDPPMLPPLDEHAFDERIATALGALRDEDIVFWLKHGRAPLGDDAIDRVAQAMPPTLTGRLATLVTRSRLSRSRAWVAQLAGALTLPPRRLTNADLPLGGYADVTTRGEVDRILPSQFALDEWDFFRRFAERELLYFRREDPHRRTQQELVIILDQGVRTWGDVRLVLAAALLAMGKQASQRGAPFSIATTSMDLIDPLQVEEESLGEIVESSDLSANPGLALERVLERPSEFDRDIVLLTHPRNLQEEDVTAAARRLAPRDRLFALTLDRHGQAELSEIRRGVPIAVRSFRVDLSLGLDDLPAAPTDTAGGWSGDVESIGFPFRFGVSGRIGAESFDFDLAGTTLLVAGPHGVCYLWDARGKLIEVLPRAMSWGRAVRWNRPHVLGVAKGFVIVETFAAERIALHIDLESRMYRCHPLGAVGAMTTWQYSPVHHSLIVPFRGGGLVIDLSTGERYRTDIGGPQSRAMDAWLSWERREVPVRLLPVTPVLDQSRREPSIWLDSHSGAVMLQAYVPHRAPESAGHSSWGAAFTPWADGQPMLRQRLILAAQMGGAHVALATASQTWVQESRLVLIHAPKGVPLGEYALPDRAFRLSANGALLARQVKDAVVEIHDVAGNVRNGSTFAGGFAHQLPFVLGADRLLLRATRQPWVIDWATGLLKVRTPDEDTVFHFDGVAATPDGVPPAGAYDPKRWLLGAAGALLAASDRYGQVAIFDRQQRLICMFFAFRSRLAGWMPDGTRFDQATSADEATLMRFGRALLAASRRREP